MPEARSQPCGRAAFARWVCAAAVTCGVLSCGPSRTGAAAPPHDTPIRVAVVAYEDFQARLDHWQQILARIGSAGEARLEFRLAVGTYGDVLHWVEDAHVDVAVLTPGVFALTFSPDGSEPADCVYLATAGVPAAVSAWASEERREPGYHFATRAVCVVAADAALKDEHDLRRAGAADELEYLFVHPLSLSGRIAPEFALRRLGLSPAEERIHCTYSHTTSLRELCRPGGARRRVAFVWDDALRPLPGWDGKLRRLPLEALDELAIPGEAIVARKGFPLAGELQARLLAYRDTAARCPFAHWDDWAQRYAPVGQWVSRIGREQMRDDAASVTLDEIIEILRHHEQSQAQPVRLAVVLSGGGAKCAYQVGAVAALEEKLAEARRRDPGSSLDIALVVGTSGGAINAVPMALGITAEKAGRDDLRAVWATLDQRELIRPSWRVRGNIGLWCALFQLAVLMVLARLVRLRAERRAWFVAAGLAVLTAVEIALGYLHLSPWRWLGENHFWHHAWLWVGFGIRASAWTLLVLSLAWLVALGVLARRGRHLATPGWLRWALVVGLVGLPLLQVLTVLFWERTFSGSAGVEASLATKFPPLIDAHLKREGRPALEIPPEADNAARLRAVSRQVIDRRLLRRDLVLTGSCLEQTTAELTDDLYFFAPGASGQAKPAFGSRGVALEEHPETLLDVVMGSGSIFPLFPPRTLEDFPAPGERVELVDGGFTHNRPVEAAVLWGATHIVLIEATPPKRIERTNFLTNAGAAFAHLYAQSQLIDARTKGRVVVFTLTPRPPHPCLLDFADNLILRTAAKGYADAVGHRGRARFRKESGEPVFVQVAAPAVGQ